METDFESLPNEEFYAFYDRFEECLKELTRNGPKELLASLGKINPWVSREWNLRYDDFRLEDELEKRRGKNQ